MVADNLQRLPPLIELCGLGKCYGGHDGEPAVEILHGIDLTIQAGEFVAIMGASGSGKSTLMHILGCLDRASVGTYRFAGRDVASLDADELAWLRREALGFVFQGYHLIRTLDASHNVQVPAVYADMPTQARQERAQALLERLGLGERGGHQPRQLSGGQQQRVSIARALMNGGHVILADEPTGALDSKSGIEVMALLKELADAGHTIILITHDPQVAAQARRVVRISDGRIVEDSGSTARAEASYAQPSLDTRRFMAHMTEGVAHSASWFGDAHEALGSAWRTLWANRFRTLLTLLGIVIGVASVIVLMAVGQGTSEQTLAKMAAIGHTQRLAVKPGNGSARGLQSVLTEADVQIVRAVPNIAIAMPALAEQVLLRAGNVELSSKMWAVTTEAMALFNGRLQQGTFFDGDDERQLATVVVLGSKVREQLFSADDVREVIGRYVLVNKVPFLVIGVLAPWGNLDYDDSVFLPFSSGSRRLVGTTNPSIIQIKVQSIEHTEVTEAEIAAALERAHRVRDFSIGNAVVLLKAEREAVRQQRLMLVLIAGISLVVGGIGIMNIMLMAVQERTREIGIRMATGARQRDIQRQFLTEAVVVSMLGGIVGVVIGLLIGVALIYWAVPVVFSIRAMLLAFGCAVVTGLVFGFMPARQAARLDPVVALASE